MVYRQYLRRRTRTLGGGISRWLETLVRVSPNLRFRFSPLYSSSQDSFCKSSSAPNVRTFTEFDWLSFRGAAKTESVIFIQIVANY